MRIFSTSLQSASPSRHYKPLSQQTIVPNSCEPTSTYGIAHTAHPMSSPRIATSRQYGATFGPDRRGSEFRVPRFFKRYGSGCIGTKEPCSPKCRLFKFPQMDFEMAVWEMTHLLIAPKKVFKSIYYHKRLYHPATSVTTHILTTCRDAQYMASTRPVLHIPVFLLPPSDVVRLVPRLHTSIFAGRQAGLDVHLCPLPGRLPCRVCNIILGSRAATWAGYCRTTRS